MSNKQLIIVIVSQLLIMIKRKEARFYLNLLAITTLIATATTFTTAALVISYSFLGFGLRTNPISCTSSVPYFTTKYSQDTYLSVINTSLLIASASALILVIVVLYLRYQFSKSPPEQQQFQAWTPCKQQSMFVLTAICLIGLIVSTAWFLSFCRQVSSDCGLSIHISWVLISLFGGLSIIAYLVAAVALLKVRQCFSPADQQVTEKEEVKLSLKTENSKIPQNQSASEQKDEQQYKKQSQKEEMAQVQQQLEQKEEIKPKKQISEPLLVPEKKLQTSRSRNWDIPDSQYEYQMKRLKKVQAQRRAQEERLEQLQRKQSRLATRSNQAIVSTQKQGNDKGNQTIINIHLTGSQSTPTANSIPIQTSPKTKKSRFRHPIYEEDSQISEHPRRKHPRKRNDEDSSRFYEKQKYGAKEQNPYEQGKPLRSNMSLEEPKKNYSPNHTRRLALGHTADVHIGPYVSSISNNNIAVPISDNFQVSQVNRIPTPFEHQNDRQQVNRIPAPFDHQPDRQPPPTFKKQESTLRVNEVDLQKRQEDSFVRKLMGQSRLEQTNPILRAPKKSKPKKKLTELEAYIKALNKNMTKHEMDQSDSEMSYSSILSHYQRNNQPERSNFTRSQLRQQFRSNGNLRQSWMAVQKKIEEKYKQK